MLCEDAKGRVKPLLECFLKQVKLTLLALLKVNHHFVLSENVVLRGVNFLHRCQHHLF